MPHTLTVTVSSLALAASFWAASTGHAGETGRFAAEIRGDLTSRVYGNAMAGAMPAAPGTPAHYTIRLGDAQSLEAVLLTTAGESAPRPGRYAVVDRLDGRAIQALVMVGRTEHPEGVFRADSGTVIVEPGAPGRIAGRFTLYATGFLGSEPGREDRHITMTGSFDAAE